MSDQSPWLYRPNDCCDFEIAIICALPLEADAVGALFDRRWGDEDPPFDGAPGDPNAYSMGMIGHHNVVLAHLAGMGKVNATAVASNCKMSFPNVKLALVVGVCGAVPFKPNGDEIVLGDVIISEGIVQFDLGRRLPDRFLTKNMLPDSLGRPNLEIRGLLAKLKTTQGREDLISKTAKYLNTMRRNPRLYAVHPGPANDKLFEATYRHSEEQRSCEQARCDGKLVPRQRLEITDDSTPAVHFGLMASGDSVMMSGEDRDRIAEAAGIIAFEMEGAGVWDCFPCVVIKGVCDYADSHKSKAWQRYAAATAAACTKAFLSFWPPSKRNKGISQARKSRDPPVFLVPFSENHLFVGRDDVLAKLRSLLFEKNSRKVALVGLGGIGKTQIALQLAYWVKNAKPDYSVLWIPALSMAGFEQECVKLVKKLGIQCCEGEGAREAMRQHLSSKDMGKWFLIIDNADDMDVLRRSTLPGGGILDFLPSNSDGRILLTTRNKQVAVAAARNEVVKLSQMGLEEASELLNKSLIDEVGPRNDRLNDDKTVARLVEVLTFLPLAIVQAAAYMNMYEVSMAEYIRLFEDRDERNVMQLLEQGCDDDTYYLGSQSAVTTTWIVSFDRIRRSDPVAADLLSFMAFIEPRAISRSILPTIGTEQQMIHAIGTLLGHGFLSQRGREATFDMHSLVHLATRRWNENEGHERELRQKTLARVAEVFPTDDWEKREVWRQYLPHALRLIASIGDIKNEDICKLGYWAGRCLHADGRVREAVARLKDVVAIQEKSLAEDHPNQLASQHELARAYLADGQTKEAAELLTQVVIIRKKTLAEYHPDLLASQHELARAYLADGQTKEAIILLIDVIDTKEKILAEDHPARLVSQHELARAYLADGQTKEAVELLEQVVMIREKTLAEYHPDRLASQHELARAYQDDGQMKKAAKLLEHVVAINETILAKDRPDRQASEAWVLFCSFFQDQAELDPGILH